MKKSEILNNIIMVLPEITQYHIPGNNLYIVLKQVVRGEIERQFTKDNNNTEPVELGPFGSLIFPYHDMGAVDSLNLFDIDELIIFSFYWKNKNNYRRSIDIGANLGLHSILMAKCGFSVTCYEPDPIHFKLLQRNLSLNNITSVTPINKAVSDTSEQLEFVRVLGNTTGSHLAGAKGNPYGKLDRFPVEVDAFQSLLPGIDIIKLDAEGQERVILLSSLRENWEKTDAFVEIENELNAESIFNHFRKLGVCLFSQKIGWKKVMTVKDMPTSYRDGMLFISCKDSMPW